MAKDELAERIRRILSARVGVTERPMFGGICFMLHGNMALGASAARGLLVRVGKDAYASALKRPHTRPMEMRGRAMEGYLYVSDAGTSRESDLRGWIDAGMSFAATLPPKVGSKPKSGRRGKV